MRDECQPNRNQKELQDCSPKNDIVYSTSHLLVEEYIETPQEEDKINTCQSIS